MPTPSLSNAFLRVSERALDAAEATNGRGIQEKAAFLAYHAFESSGAALCYSRGVRYHPLPHSEKINRFNRTARPERFGTRVTQLAIELQSLGNRCLYPRALGTGRVEQPENVITRAQATRLIARVRSLASAVTRVV
jgi:hypothetical protein